MKYLTNQIALPDQPLYDQRRIWTDYCLGVWEEAIPQFEGLATDSRAFAITSTIVPGELSAYTFPQGKEKTISM